jgi:hypothetical protein
MLITNANFNSFQSNFSANRILPSSYLFTPFISAIFLQAQPCKYNAQSLVHIKNIWPAEKQKEYNLRYLSAKVE